MLVALLPVRRVELNKRIIFKSAAAFLIQSCTVTAKQTKKKEVTWGANVSTAKAGTTPTKPKMETTGVQLRYYKKDYFVKLTKPQQQEVLAWN